MKSFWKKVMTLLIFLMMPAIFFFGISLLIICRKCYEEFLNWLGEVFQILDLNLENSVPNRMDYAPILYGLHGSLTELGNAKLRELSRNLLSFYVHKDLDNLFCYIVSSEGQGMSYRFPFLYIKRNSNLYPISIEIHNGNKFEDIFSDHALKKAFLEILESQETSQLISAMIYVFWKKYDKDTGTFLPENPAEAKEYEKLMKLRNANNLRNNKDKTRLIELQMKNTPVFNIGFNEKESTDIEKFCKIYNL